MGLSEQQSHTQTHTHTQQPSPRQTRAKTLCLEQEKHFVYAVGPFTAQPAKEGNQLIPGSLVTVALSTDEVSISHPADGVCRTAAYFTKWTLFSPPIL